jgi:ferredoxin
MGHNAGKDIYRKLGRKIDGLTMRAPWNDALYSILKELYTAEDAELIIKMPYGFATLDRLAKVTGIAPPQLERQLESLCPRGLVMDICIGGEYYYTPSPFAVGFFEFTMMRTRGEVDFPKMAKLFRAYLDDGLFLAANAGSGQRISFMRALPWEGCVEDEDHIEVLDYEKASAIVEATDRFALGVCACRHQRRHLGEDQCKAPHDNCSVFGSSGVDFMLRNGFGREVSKTEMLENIARSRELGLVINADNVQRSVRFMCHCCSCCCEAVQGITKHGYTNTVVTSSFIAGFNQELCKGCGTCSRRCPISAIELVNDSDSKFRKNGRPQVDESFCIGCGVCAVHCRSGAMKLRKRAQRFIHPESTFERVILQCLENGTLQNQLFDDPGRKTQAFLRGVVGGFLRLPPVKRALMSDALRSRFLHAMKFGARAAGKQMLTEL